MLKVTEFIDMPQIERLRKAALGRGLDEKDNFSWHAALFDGENPIGVCRFYRVGEDLFVDEPALLTDEPFHRELLFRALLLKASSVDCRYVTAAGEQSYLAKFGFAAQGDCFGVPPQAIVFPHDCCGTT